MPCSSPTASHMCGVAHVHLRGVQTVPVHAYQQRARAGTVHMCTCAGRQTMHMRRCVGPPRHPCTPVWGLARCPRSDVWARHATHAHLCGV
eukprot:351734-Chlamydomonas_euryale.AAC.2